MLSGQYRLHVLARVVLSFPTAVLTGLAEVVVLSESDQEQSGPNSPMRRNLGKVNCPSAVFARDPRLPGEETFGVEHQRSLRLGLGRFDVFRVGL